MAPRNEEQRLPPRPTLLSIPSFAKSYQSYQSYQSSFEADDERSTSDSNAMSPRTSIENGERAETRYPGEDKRPTTGKELAGWYMYAFAAETYMICAISSFIPILLESLARDNGVLLSDRKTPCPSSDIKPPKGRSRSVSSTCSV
ncbi:hypothetical protein PG987_003864 [Apiospora arundinis]